MLGGWLHDAGGGGGGGGGPSESSMLPFARAGTASGGRQQKQHPQQSEEPHQGAGVSRRPHYYASDGPAFDLDPSSVVEVGER